MKKYNCPVCGYPELDEAPWGELGNIPSHDICDCCGVEFGYEDGTEEAREKYRNRWLELGGKWLVESSRPEGWSLKEQLKNINIKL